MRAKHPESHPGIKELAADILDSVGDALIAVDGKSRVVYVNKEIGRLLGRDVSELVGKNIADLIPEASGWMFNKHLEKAISEGVQVKLENFSFINKRFTTYFYPNKNVIIILLHDITSQWHVDELHRMALFLLDRLNESICLVRSDGRLFHVNDEICRLLGYSREELIHMKIFDIDPGITVDGWESYFGRIKEGAHVNFESRLKTRDGRTIPVDLCANYVKLYGNEYYSVAARDITRRKRVEEALHESERKYRDLVEKVNDIIWQIDEKFVFTYISPQIFNAWGFMPEEVVGKTPMDFMPPDEAERVSMIIEDASEKRDKLLIYGNRHLRKDGRVMYLEVSGQPIIDVDGVYRGYRGVARDITERKKLEEALIDAEDFNRSVLDSLSSNIAVLDEAGAIVYVNSSWVKFARENGARSDEAVGMGINYIDVCQRACGANAEEAPDAVKGILSVMHGEREFFELEYPCHSPDFKRWFQMRITPFVGRKTRGVVVYHNDITSRRMNEEALRVSEANLKRAEEIASIGHWQLEVRTNEARWSDTCYILLGYSVRGCAPGWASWSARIHPDDRELAEQNLKDAISDDAHYVNDYRVVLPDGSIRYMHDVADSLIRDDKGDPVMIFGTMQDITERKRVEEALQESEERSRATFEQAAVGIVHVALDGRFLRFNQKLCDITGYTREELSKLTFQDITYPEDLESDFRNNDRLLAGETRTFSMEKRYIRKDGSLVWVNLTASLLYKNGKPENFIGVVEDISERKQAEEELANTKAQVELYLDLMSHDINNLNQVALGYLELIDGTVKDEKLKELVAKPIEAVNNSSYLIENVRKLQKSRTGQYKAETVDLDKILSELYAQYSHVPGKDIAICYTHDPGCVVMADGLIKDVFSNLIWNAIKHSNGESVHINMTLKRYREDGNEYCRIIVEDDGPGIPDAQKETVFARFQRGNTKASGKGLGLYLVKTLVEGYQGRVRVEDRVPGDHTKGARFMVMLPAVEK